MNKVTVKYETGLKAALMNSDEAAAYLDAALEADDQAVFLLALRDIADAYGLSRVAQDTLLNRENLYRMLSSTGNLQLSSLMTLLRSIGLRLTVQVAPI